MNKNEQAFFSLSKIFNDKRLSAIEKSFLKYLIHFGTIKRAELRSKLNAIPNAEELTDVEFRALKKRVVLLGYPVGSSGSRGYFWEFSVADLNEGVKEYRDRAANEFKTAAIKEKNFLSFYKENPSTIPGNPENLKLFPADAPEKGV